MDLVFATHNADKLQEVKALLLEPSIRLLSLSDIGFHEELPEPYLTIKDNAIAKATYLSANTGYNCFSDDSGLEVEALDGAPGVFSARYAGPQRSHKDNNNKILNELKKVKNRKAHFISVICLLLKGNCYLFEGTVNGTITEKSIGKDGFGYDPIFQPEGYSKTFAEMSLDEKNKISHRAIAIHKLADFLNKM